MNLSDTARRMMDYARPQWRMLAASFLFFTLGAAIEPAIPALFKKLIDSGFQEGLKYPIWIVPLVIIGLFALRGTFNFTGTYGMSSASTSIVLALRRDLMQALLRADAKLFTEMSPGLAVSKVINDPQHASQTLSSSMISIIKDAMSLAALVGYLIYLNWQLTLISFVSMPLLGITIKLVQKRLSKVGEAQYQSQQRLIGPHFRCGRVRDEALRRRSPEPSTSDHETGGHQLAGDARHPGGRGHRRVHHHHLGSVAGQPGLSHSG